MWLLNYREVEDTIVIVSEPLDEDHKSWIAVPDNHAVVASAGERARLLPLLQPMSYREAVIDAASCSTASMQAKYCA